MKLVRHDSFIAQMEGSSITGDLIRPFFKMGGFPKNSAAAVISCCEFLSLFSKCWKKFAKQLTCGAMTKIVIKVKRVKLIHTKERKNRKKEPIPAPKCPEEKMK